MVVSKDNKRRRKETETPPPPAPSLSVSKATQQSSAAAAAVESSPEMPKRNKVQAQRKFAQGQSAPQTSAYSISLNAASCSNSGPSTSSESREPPIEILPNKRPNTEDFLTFLCFRGTSALPPHLDFRNEGHSREPQPTTTRKPVNKIPKPKKKGKRGRPKNVTKNDVPMATTPTATPITEKPEDKTSITQPTQTVQQNVKKSTSKAPETTADASGGNVVATEKSTIITGAVRKRAEVLSEGNRRGRRSGAGATNAKETDSEKCNSSPEAKRRSNRTSTKEGRSMVELETDEDEDGELSTAQDDVSKVGNEPPLNALGNEKIIEKNDAKNVKSPVNRERKSETPSKESETTKSTMGRRGRPPSSVNKKSDEAGNATPNDLAGEKVKVEKAPVKRVRQRESPIFIPSPESSGRMTRQRAFFEPVKVPTPPQTIDNDDEIENKSVAKTNDFELKPAIKEYVGREKEAVLVEQKLSGGGTNKEAKANASIYAKEAKLQLENGEGNGKPKSSLNVFDFSSDDEQPLAKSIKLKKGKANPKKQGTGNVSIGRGRKSASKKSIDKDEKLGKETPTTATDAVKTIPDTKVETETTKNEEKSIAESDDDVKAKANKRGRAAKKKAVDEEQTGQEELSPPSPKKSATMRQPRKPKSKAEEQLAEPKNRSPSPPARNQRPSRKTKEAAAIYMGIIGHKLQLADDEEDDLSLSSFPDIPNVKEMEKMENEIRKNASQPTAKLAPEPTTTQKARKPSPKPPPPRIVVETPVEQANVAATTTAASTAAVEKPPARRGRPPKQSKVPPVPPPKREIEGMLVKKGALAKIAASVESAKAKSKSEHSKAESEDEDFLINEELNETKRKLEKSFSDSDDEPLAIKVNVKGSDKDAAQAESPKAAEAAPKKVMAAPVTQTQPAATTTAATAQSHTTTTPLTMLPLTAKPIITTIPPPITAYALPHSTHGSNSTSPLNQPVCSGFAALRTTPPGGGLKLNEKKSPIPTSKILNVPATYAIPGTTGATTLATLGATGLLNKSSPYLPQASPHYHNPYVRPPPTPTHPFSASTVKSPTTPTSTPSPLKYQTAPTTYPPPIEAYQCPKINPNFLTPKFDRTTLPRTNNFPSPSPVKFDTTRSSLGISGLLTSTASASLTSSSFTTGVKALPTANFTTTNAIPSTSASAAAAQAANAHNSNADPLKEEIGNILASLMPSKEESGKVFGIASVSLAQSSGPDNTKCTLGKCGSIHKPILGPVVPTEGYFGDQLTSKERRKAKVNMTHEQIQKWLIECSSNPDDIQDDLDDEFDDNLRSNQGSPPPPGREDKESTSFSSSSKTTRELGRSESTWSTKGPSLKATPVVAISHRKDDDSKTLDSDLDFDRTHPVNLTQKSIVAAHNEAIVAAKELLPDKKADKKPKDAKTAAKDNNKAGVAAANSIKDNKQQQQKATASRTPSKANAAQSKNSPAPVEKNAAKTEATTPPAVKPTRGKKSVNISTPSTPTTSVASPKAVAQSSTAKRTPVYNQKTVRQYESAKPAVAQKRGGPIDSIYSFDKDDEPSTSAATPTSKPGYRRQGRQDTQQAEAIAEAPSSPPPTMTALNERSPSKKRAAAAAAATAVSLTLSPTENCKLVKVSLDAGQPSKQNKTTRAAKKAEPAPKPAAPKPAPSTAKAPEVAESDAEGATFYIPLQGTGVGGSGEGGIQGVAVKLGREGPDGPNQKVVMQATLVTKAQMDTNSKPLPDSLNTNELVKTLLNVANNADSSTTAVASTSSAKTAVNSNSAPAAATNSASSSLKNVPIGTVQPRFKASEQPSTSANVSGLVRVNSNSSLFSGSAKSRTATGQTSTAATLAAAASKKFKDDTPIKMANNTAFPRHDDPTQMVEAPIFRPTEKEFADPIEFIERITPIAARFGICKIIPPATFKPECRIADEMRFTAYNQYVHKMLHRWGPSAKELSAIRKYLATQSIVMNHPPWIGGMEVDLPRLYHTVQELGGLKEVIEKKKWARVAEEMCIPKLAQDRATKLDDIYCKYLLPYDTLSPAERQKLFEEVEADWAKREARARRNADRFVNTESVSNEEDDASSDEDDDSDEEMDTPSMECIVKGRSMPLSQFYRIARNTMALWFKNTDPTVTDVEAEFWRHVAVRDSHVCVHSGSIDSSGWGYGFPSPGPKGKGSNYARHPWNLKVLTNNAGSVLRSLGPVMGVTVPTLHVGMLFSACCWYRDPHGLSWIEYLHTGASKVWYGIPDDQSANFRKALTDIIPTHCQNKTIWLPCDTVMVPPHMLTDRKVSLCRIEQKPGEFIVVFPRAYTSSLATGYVVSESVYFATMSWLELAKDDFTDIHNSCEPAMFSLEQLLFALGYDQRVNSDTLQQMLPMLNDVCEKETAAREQLRAAGVTSSEKVQNEKGNNKNAKKQQPPHKTIESECDLCRANLYISMVRTEEGNVYCLQHALKNLNNGNIQAKQCKLLYAFNVDDVEQLIKSLHDKIKHKQRPSIVGKKSK